MDVITLAMAKSYTDSQRIIYADLGDVFTFTNYMNGGYTHDYHKYRGLGDDSKRSDDLEKIVRITAIVEGDEKVFPAGVITFVRDGVRSYAKVDGVPYVYVNGSSFYVLSDDENNYVTKVEFAENIYPVPTAFMPDETIDLDAYGIQVATLVMSGGGTTEYTDADTVQRFATEVMEKKPKFALMSLAQTFRCTIAALTENMLGFFLVALNGRTMISAKISIVVSSDKITVVAEVG